MYYFYRKKKLTSLFLKNDVILFFSIKKPIIIIKKISLINVICSYITNQQKQIRLKNQNYIEAYMGFPLAT